VLAYQSYTNPPAWRPRRGGNPCHAEVVDLDGDGRRICSSPTSAASPRPTSRSAASLAAAAADATFEPIPSRECRPRRRVRAADFRGSGKLDLVVAVFGWRGTGEILIWKTTRRLVKPKLRAARHR